MRTLLSWWIAKKQLGEKASLYHPSWPSSHRLVLEEWNNPKSDYLLCTEEGQVLERNYFPSKKEQETGWEVVKEDESWRMEVPF